MSNIKNLTPEVLKRLIREEKKRLKVDVEEVDAKDMANTLAKNVDYLKALKIHEVQLAKKLKRIIKEKTRIKKQIIKEL